MVIQCQHFNIDLYSDLFITIEWQYLKMLSIYLLVHVIHALFLHF